MKNKMLAKTSSILVSVLLALEQAGFAQMAPQPGVPLYLRNIAPIADTFRPVHLRAITPDMSLSSFDLSLDPGDAKQLSDTQLKGAAEQLMKYFLIGVQLPNSMFWVNLRPDAPDQVIDPYLERTDVGRILLEADLQLKKDLARLTDPDTATGREYWDKLYRKAEALFPREDIEVPTATRPWIVPAEIVLGEDGQRAYIYKATLKVMLEQDYIKDAAGSVSADPRQKELNEYSSQLMRSSIVPLLTRQVNASKRYAALRQVYYSLILAQWFKANNPAAPALARKDLAGLTSAAPWSQRAYYEEYKRSVSQGEYRKEQYAQSRSGMVIRTYTSGGINVFPAGLQTNSMTIPVLPDNDRTAKVSALIRGGEIVVSAADAPGAPRVRDGGDLEVIDDEPGIEVVKEGAYGVSYGKMKSYGFRDCIAVAVRDASGKGVLLHLSPGIDIAYMMSKVWAEFGLKRKDARLRDLEISVAAGFYFRQTNILSDLGVVLRAHGATLSEQNKYISDDDVRNIMFDPATGKMYELRNILDGAKPGARERKVHDWHLGIFMNAPDTLTREQARLEQVQFEHTLETAVRTGLVLKRECVYRAPFRVITGHTLTFEVSNLDQLLNELARNAYDGYASFFDPRLAAAGLRKPSSSTRGLINIVVSESQDAYVIEIRDNGADSRGADTAHKGESLVRAMVDPQKNKPYLYFGRMGVFEKILNGDAETGSEGVLKYLWNKAGGAPAGAMYEKIPGKDGIGMTVRIRIPHQAVEKAKPGVFVPTAFAIHAPAEAESSGGDTRDGGKEPVADINAVPDPADVSFLITDLKLLPDGSIKILEFGRGMHSGFEGYEALYGENGIMSQFWDRLAALRLPIRYTISVMTLGFGGEEFVHDRAVKKLDRLPGSRCTLFASFLHELETGAFGAKRPDFDPRDLSTYSGILVYGGSEYGDDEILEIMKAYPWILVLDGRANTVDLYAGDKFLTNTLFEGDLARYRPGWKMFPKQYRPDLADSIRRDMPAQRYVIKPLEASRGRGVLVVEPEALDDVLKKILTRDNAAEKTRAKMEEFRIIDGEDDPYEYWVIDKNPVFLIETCEASQPVRANGEQYDGTMRMVFTLTRNKGDIAIDFIDAYWKFPSRPLGQGPSRDSVVSKIHREDDADLDAPISAPVSNRDKAIVEEQLKHIILGIYQRMISATPDAVMRRLIGSVDESHRAYGLYLLSRTANIPVDLAVEAQKAAAQHSGLYDAILADLIDRRYDWKKDSFLIPLAGVLMGSHDAAVRDGMIQLALDKKKLKPFRELLLDHADLWETAGRLETRARFASFLYEQRRINARELLASYEKIFAASDYNARKFIVRDLVAKNRVLRAAWLEPYLKDKETLLFALWYNVLEENKEKIQKAAFAAKDEGSLGRYLMYRQDVETLTDEQIVKLLRTASVNQKLKLCEWYKEIIRERSTMTRSMPMRRLYAVLDDYFHAWQTIFESFQAATEACDEYIYSAGKDGGTEKKVAGIDMRSLRASRASSSGAVRAFENIQPVSAEMLRVQWEAICQAISAGSLPYNELHGYITQCSAQGAQEELTAVLDYFATVLRMEEELAVVTPPEIKALLAALG